MKYKRKLKSLNNKTGLKIVKQIGEMVRAHEKYKKSIFWKPIGDSNWRRSQGFESKLFFILDGAEYEWEQDLILTSNCYNWTSMITKNGKEIGVNTMKTLAKKWGDINVLRTYKICR